MRLSECILEDNGLFGKFVEVGRGGLLVSIHAEMVGPQRVDENHYDIRPRLRGARCRRLQRRIPPHHHRGGAFIRGSGFESQCYAAARETLQVNRPFHPTPRAPQCPRLQAP